MTSLRSRLDALQGVRRCEDKETADAVAPLSQRLERLGRQRARSTDEGPISCRPLDAALGGYWQGEGVLRVDTLVPLTERHGIYRLADLRALAEAGDEPWAGPPERFLLFDTETTGLAGGTGTLIFLCGLGWLEEDAILIRQFLLSRPAAEPRFLDAVARELASPGVLVSYNGLAFDSPLLAARFRLNGRPDAASACDHLDLLHFVRRAFRPSWPDCRLSTAEQKLLGFHREGDIHGADAPAIWLEHLRRGRAEGLAGVLRHNRLDLLSLALLLPRLAEVYRRPEVAGAAPGAIARFLIRRGRTEAAHAILGRNESALDDGDRLLLAWTARRCGDSARAVKIWSSLAARRNPLALEALAKYHEHALDDCGTAAMLAALLPAGARRQRRLERLNRKLAGPGKEVGGCRGM